MNTEDAIQAAVDRIVSGYNLALKKAVSSARAKAHRAGMLAGLKEAAGLAGEHNRSGDEWVPGSLWDRLHREFTERIRARIAEIEGGLE